MEECSTACKLQGGASALVFCQEEGNRIASGGQSHGIGRAIASHWEGNRMASGGQSHRIGRAIAWHREGNRITLRSPPCKSTDVDESSHDHDSGGHVVMWSCGHVVMWLCGHVVTWSCGHVVMWSCLDDLGTTLITSPIISIVQ
jgi:hypothetical protein